MENDIFIATEHFWSPSWHKQQIELWYLLQNWQSYLFFTRESPHLWLANIWKLFKNRHTSLLLPSKSAAKTVWPAYKLLFLFPLFAVWSNEETFPCSMERADRDLLSQTWPCSSKQSVPQSPGGLSRCLFQSSLFLPPAGNCDHRWKAAAEVARDSPNCILNVRANGLCRILH